MSQSDFQKVILNLILFILIFVFAIFQEEIGKTLALLLIGAAAATITWFDGYSKGKNHIQLKKIIRQNEPE